MSTSALDKPVEKVPGRRMADHPRGGVIALAMTPYCHTQGKQRRGFHTRRQPASGIDPGQQIEAGSAGCPSIWLLQGEGRMGGGSVRIP
jgi:hypothetical protein